MSTPTRRRWRGLAAGILVAGALVALPAGTAHAATGCQVTYTVRSQWQNGFTGDLVVKNLGDALSSWNVTWTFAGNQQLQQSWNGDFTQSGNQVTIRNAPWNGSLPSGGTVNPGFNAGYSGTNVSPTAFALNGVACTGPNTSPTVSITAPAANTRYTAPASIPITATASDPDAGDSIAKVEFYHDGLLLGTDTSSPYTYTWTGVPAQSAAYSLQAKAYDSKGAVTTSTAVPVFVDAPTGPAILATPSPLTVPEGGSTPLSVKLNQAPTSNVTVAVARTGDTDITVSPTSLTFTTANWNTAQTVTVSAAQDADSVNGAATINLTASGWTSASVPANESDDDVAGGTYVQRFLEQYQKLHSSGYFSPEGVPYHAIETLVVEAPDHGHETTSEAFSYWIWLEANYGRVKQDWAPFNKAWETMEKYIIPTHANQTTGGYNPNDPADYAPEADQPSLYPSQGGKLDPNVKVGVDPLYNELVSTYGNADIYGMHWLEDVDNVYGFSSCTPVAGSKVSYINTYQRGPQESVWETVAHPSCENFTYGQSGAGYLPLFISGTPAKQWRYTNAPDADARAVQAAYWALQWATEQGKAADVTATVAKAAKMGDYLRYGMYDKYFKKPGCTSTSCAAGTGKDSAAYLMSWYYAWGGDMGGQWAFRIGSSHNHQGYQNPLAAWALANVSALAPRSPSAKADWQTSLGRQLEFYQWLQSSEGAFAGGATNSWGGNYSAPPAGTPTFYGMFYDYQPVYHDPASNQWFGFQAWSVERVAEYYYATGDAKAKAMLDKWVSWAIANTTFTANGDFKIPDTLSWTGAPNTWNPSSPQANTNLHVSVVSSGTDVGVAAAYARLLTFYGAKANNAAAKTTAKKLLDGIWLHTDSKGVGIPETRADYNRFDDVWSSSNQQGLFIPSGYSGTMPNGDVIAPGKSFLDIRSFYKSDPAWPAVQAYLNGTGPAPTFTFHRFWAQSDIAMAMADYGLLIGS
ncbi:glycoside hydrolase family 48 protein [Dactylosporangium sucinum]|uniref:glycoside hydrolase family 48 protein n=1 Tax=Dactylosporangium sucinum TaxID=1424081 RepID=UPI001E2EBC79|nr:glycoside hydrolase family 48 protein [Dactylosporangium sucinum]